MQAGDARQDRKGLLPLAKECWQGASGQTEHPTFKSANEFVTAAGRACGHKFLSTLLYAQVEEIADHLGISKWKPDVIAEEPAPRQAASTVISIPTRAGLHSLYLPGAFSFIFARPSAEDS